MAPEAGQMGVGPRWLFETRGFYQRLSFVGDGGGAGGGVFPGVRPGRALFSSGAQAPLARHLPPAPALGWSP